MKTYQLLIDTWEGQLDIDEAVLKANGVAGMMIRLNDINGGHHKDEYFDVQWEQARGFVRVPYFVYNPWVSGAKNFEWLAAHMPEDAEAVGGDLEVRKTDYPKNTYAAEVEIFKKLCLTRWYTIFYTGQWFLQYLSSWPSDVDYWWAQYPLQFYPSSPRSLTWGQLRVELEAFSGPSNGAYCPGPLRMWQFTGDKLILPGNPKPMDVNVFFGTYQELEALFGKAEGGGSEPADMVTHPFDGVVRTTGRRYGSNFIVTKCDPRKVRFEVVHSTIGTRRMRPSGIAKAQGADFAWNGSDWDSKVQPYLPYGPAVSQGETYIERTEAVPATIWMKDGSVSIDHRDKAGQFNVMAGVRYLVQDGAIKSYLYGTEAKYTESHPRSIEFIDKSGWHCRLTVDGVNPDGSGNTNDKGMTLLECAKLVRDEFGAMMAHDVGGGGDSVEVMNQMVMNSPADIDTSGNPGVERYVPQVLLGFVENGGEMPETNGLAKENGGRTPTKRNNPSRYGSSVGSLPARSEVEFVRLADVIVSGPLDKPNDKWLELPDGTFVNFILDGVQYFDILREPDSGTGILPAYFTAHDADGNELARYTKG